jgi:hypothetical protein
MGQIALPLSAGLGLNPARIVLGNANQAAVDGLLAPETWPFRTAILSGPPRCGKSMLAQWFATNAAPESCAAMIDDADKQDETALFHRWNRAQEQGETLLLTVSQAADEADVAWHIALPDLASRMGAALHLQIGAPDDTMLAALIAAHAEARGLNFADDGLRYLASRCERSHLGAESLVALIDRLSLERKAPPGPAIWREALEELNGPDAPRLL